MSSLARPAAAPPSASPQPPSESAPPAVAAPSPLALRGGFVLLWSSGVVAGAVGVRHLPPLTLTTLRFACSALVAALLALAVRAPWPRGRAQLRELAITGLLLQALQFGGFYLGFSHGVSAAVLALLLGLNPVVTSLLAWPLLGERTSGRQWAGLALGVAGVVVAVAGGLHVDGRVLAGIGWSALGLLGLALGTIRGRRHGVGAHALTGLSVQLAVAAVPVALLALVSEQPHLGAGELGATAGALAWLVLANSLLATSLLFKLARRDGAARTSALFLVMPPVTAVMGAVALDEPLTTAAIVGLALSAAGLKLGLSRRTAAPAAAPDAAEAATTATASDASAAGARRRG